MAHAINLDADTIQTIQHYLAAVVDFGKAKDQLKLHEVAIVAKTAALNYAKKEHSEAINSRKVAKFEDVPRYSSIEEEEEVA